MQTQTLLILIGIFVGIGIFLNIWLRKKLKAKKIKWFSYNHVNKLHKRLDWSLRLVMLSASLISFVIILSVEMYEYGLLPYIILWISAIFEGLLRTFMEWKYYPNSKDYIVTLINTIILFFFMCLFYILITNQLETYFFY